MRNPACVVQDAKGDESGFRDYVLSRRAALLRTACLLTGNQADAEDLLQAALAKTYTAWRRIEDRSALDGYVRRAMVNTHISWWRRRRLEEYPTDDIPDRPVQDHAGESDELHDSLSRALRRLPERMRAAVVLRYYEDMSEAEIAGVLGISLGTVKSTVSRAVAKLRTDAELLGLFGVPEQPGAVEPVPVAEQGAAVPVPGQAMAVAVPGQRRS
ncbi:MAG TPA: SigE family RNA polymerase sigma factor [Streptosporangiaceae bacterium]